MFYSLTSLQDPGWRMEESLLNFSRVEEDPFAKLPTENITEPSFREPSAFSMVLTYVLFTAELINFVLAIASVIADVLMIYFIFKYKRLRKDLNLYIANYAIMNLSYYVVAPILLLVHVLFSMGFSFFVHLLCYIAVLENTFLFGSFIFATLLGVEWTISFLKPELLVKYRKSHKYKYLILYCLIAVIMMLGGLGCLFKFEFLQTLLFYSMPFVIFALVFIHYVRRRKVLGMEQLKTEYALWIFTIAVGCYVPIYLLDLILTSIGPYAYHTITLIIFLCEYILSFLATPSPVFILYYLIKWNKHFKMAFDTTFKRSVRNYGADNLDDASDNEEIVEDGGQKNVTNESNGLSRAEILVP